MLAALVAGCGGSARPAEHARERAEHRPAHAAAVRVSVARQRAQLARLTALGRPVYCGGGRHRLVALTFDDGPGPYTPLAPQELRAARAPAPVFPLAPRLPHLP